MSCKYGLQTDPITHCPICKCKTVNQELSDLFDYVTVSGGGGGGGGGVCFKLCRMHCSYGNKRNSAGCPICA